MSKSESTPVVSCEHGDLLPHNTSKYSNQFRELHELYLLISYIDAKLQGSELDAGKQSILLEQKRVWQKKVYKIKNGYAKETCMRRWWK